ncbi:MAG: hypothetical protein ACK556_24925 [Pseudanabaena sp.]
MRLVDIATNIQYEKVDDKQIERMLIKQAVCLDVMFIATADSAMEDGNPEKIMAAAKLQEASRKTLLALHEIRNPKKSATFVKQLVENQFNQLVTDTNNQPVQLGESYAETVDFRTEAETVTVKSPVATVAAKHRRKN